MIVLIDNYDSFTYNLYQLLGEHEEEIVVVRNDEITIEQLEEMNPRGIVLSPDRENQRMLAFVSTSSVIFIRTFPY